MNWNCDFAFSVRTTIKLFSKWLWVEDHKCDWLLVQCVQWFLSMPKNYHTTVAKTLSLDSAVRVRCIFRLSGVHAPVNMCMRARVVYYKPARRAKMYGIAAAAEKLTRWEKRIAAYKNGDRRIKIQRKKKKNDTINITASECYRKLNVY